MKFNYTTFETDNLFVIKYTGFFSIEDYTKSVITFFSFPDKQNYSLMIVDLREVSYDDVTIVDKLVDNRKKEGLPDIKFAYLVSSPRMTAIIELYTSSLERDKYGYFSTIKSACNFLDLKTQTMQKVEKVLSDY